MGRCKLSRAAVHGQFFEGLRNLLEKIQQTVNDHDDGVDDDDDDDDADDELRLDL